MCSKIIVKYNSSYVYLPNVFIKPEKNILAHLQPKYDHKTRASNNEPCTFVTVSHEQQISNLGSHSLVVSFPFHVSSQNKTTSDLDNRTYSDLDNRTYSATCADEKCNPMFLLKFVQHKTNYKFVYTKK